MLQAIILYMNIHRCIHIPMYRCTHKLSLGGKYQNIDNGFLSVMRHTIFTVFRFIKIFVRVLVLILEINKHDKNYH